MITHTADVWNTRRVLIGADVPEEKGETDRNIIID